MKRLLILATLLLSAPALAQTQIDLTRQVKNTLPVANGGTGTTTSTGTGDTVRATGPTIVNPILTGPTLDTFSIAQLRDRANHTGSQAISTITGLQTALDGKLATPGSQSAGSFYAAPSGGSGIPTFRAIVAGDVPTLNQSTTGSAATLTTGRTFSITGDGSGTSSAFNGSANASIPLTISNGAVSLAKMADVASGTVFYRTTAGTGAPEVQTLATLKTALGLTGTNSGDQTITLSGDVSGSGTGAITASIGAATVTNAKLATVASATIKGRATAGTGAPEDLTGTQATALLDLFTSADKGLVPASGGGTANYLRADGTWASPSAGSGSPGGATTQIQYNNAGSFGGDADFTWTAATNTLALPGTDTGIELAGITTEPSAPSAGTGRLYAKSIATRVMPKWIGPSGVDYPLQSHIGLNNVRIWRGGATTTATTFASTIGSLPYTGASPTAPTIPTLASTSLRNQTYRSTISTGATAGGLAYIRGNQLTMWRGNAAGLGGFFVVHRFALSGTLQAGLRSFAGVVDVASNPTNIDPTSSSTPGGIGLALNANTGNWRLVNNASGTARTSLDLGASFPVNNTDLIELALFSAPNGSGISYRVTNLSTAATTTGTLTTNIPASTTFLAPTVWITNNATAAAQTLDFVSTYVETDF